MSDQRTRVLSMLQAAGPEGVTTAQFIQAFVSRFSARIKELREAGWEIETRRLARGSFKYTLQSSAPPSPVVSAEPGKDAGASSALPLGAEEEPSDVLFDVDIGPVSAITGKPVPLDEAA